MFPDRDEYMRKVGESGMEYWRRSCERRWEYIEKVIEELESIDPDTLLEIGAAGIPLSDKSDVMDIKGFGLENSGRFIEHDITEIPWPAENNSYEVITALQVLEHCTLMQKAVFKEMERVSSDIIILSVPYRWENSKSGGHTDIDENTLREWTGRDPYKIEIVGDKKKRAVFCYKISGR